MRHNFRKNGRFAKEEVAMPIGSSLAGLKEEANKPVTKLKVVLPDGLLLEGPKDKVLEVAKREGYSLEEIFPSKDFYHSSTHGPIRISEMQTNHLMNATAKLMQPYLKDLVKSSKFGKDFLQGLSTWRDIDKHKSLLALIHELSKRHNR